MRAVGDIHLPPLHSNPTAVAERERVRGPLDLRHAVAEAHPLSHALHGDADVVPRVLELALLVPASAEEEADA